MVDEIEKLVTVSRIETLFWSYKRLRCVGYWNCLNITILLRNLEKVSTAEIVE